MTSAPATAPIPRMLGAQFRAQFTGYLRTPAFSVTSVVLPVMFFAFFGLTHAKQHFPNGASVGAYLLASFGAYAVSSLMVFNFGIGVALARGAKEDLLQRATPLRPAVAIAANVLNALLFALVALVVLFAFGVVAGGVQEPISTWLALTLRLVIGSIPLIGMGMTIGYSVGPSAASAVTNVIYLPMAFASGLFLPLSQMPDWVQTVARYLPLYHFGELGWGVLGSADEPLGQSLLWLAAWTVVFFGLAVRFYRLEQQRKFS
ncbi:MAG TPA: ABC transporter permease [Candidatus Dormibacteraeota bacterium]